MSLARDLHSEIGESPELPEGVVLDDHVGEVALVREAPMNESPQRSNSELRIVSPSTFPMIWKQSGCEVPKSSREWTGQYESCMCTPSRTMFLAGGDEPLQLAGPVTPMAESSSKLGSCSRRTSRPDRHRLRALEDAMPSR